MLIPLGFLSPPLHRITPLLLLMLLGSFSSVLALTPEAQRHYQAGQTAWQAGQTKQAVQQFQQALTLDNSDPLPYIALANLYSQQGNTQAAIQQYLQAISRNSTDAMLYYSLGNLYEQQQQWQPALEAYEACLFKNPSYRYSHLALARVEEQLNRLEEAQQHVVLFLAGYPNHTEGQRLHARLALRLRQPQTALTQLLHLQEQQGEQFTDTPLLVQAYGQLEQWQQVLDVAEAALGIDSMIITEWVAKASQKLKKHEVAIQRLKRATQTQPNNAKAWWLLAQQYQEAGNLNEALQTLQQFIALQSEQDASSPLLHDAKLNEVLWLNQLERYSESELLANTALQHPQLPPELTPDLERELAYSLLKQQRYPQALKLYTGLLVQPSEQRRLATVKNTLFAFEQSNQVSEGVVWANNLYSQLQQRNNPPADVLNELRSALVQWQLQLANQAAQTAPTNGVTPTESVSFTELEQRYQSILALQTTGEAPAPAVLQAHLGLARLQERRQQTAEALQHYQAVLSQPESLLAVDSPLRQEAQLGVLRLTLTQQPTEVRQQAMALLNSPPYTTPLLQTALQQLITETWITQPSPEAVAWAEATLLLLPKESFTQWPMDLLLDFNSVLQEQKAWKLSSQWIQLWIDQPRLSLQQRLEATVALASNAYQQGQWPQCKHYAQQALALEPKHAPSVFYLALVAEKQQQWPTALQHYQTLVTLPPAEGIPSKALLAKKVSVLKTKCNKPVTK
ncbi:MAG: tetratricopeptide repeat protein [Vampirovibrionales bacterium]